MFFMVCSFHGQQGICRGSACCAVGLGFGVLKDGRGTMNCPARQRSVQMIHAAIENKYGFDMQVSARAMADGDGRAGAKHRRVSRAAALVLS
jgi:hypothetical protein